MDGQQGTVEALAVSNGRIIAMGTNSELKELSKNADQVIDMGKYTILPGFIDTHAHLVGLGHRLLHLDLGEASSAEEAMRLLVEHMKDKIPGQLVTGYNWDESNWTEPRYLTKEDLDPVTPKNPVILIRVCGHLVSVNSLILKQLSLDFDNPGVDQHSETGEPTGVLRDIEIDIRKLSGEEKDLSHPIIEACRYANRVGITSAHENLYHRQLPFVAEYIKLSQKRRLTVRVYANLETKLLDQLAGLGLPSGLGDDYFRLGGLKVFIDGSLGAQTAAVSKPYADNPDSRGLLLLTEADYEFLLETANKLGLQVSTHAIGDRGIDLVLRIHEKISKADEVKKLRHNIIHAELLTPPLIERVKQLDMLVLQQPNFVHRWGLPGGMYDMRLGPERAQQLNNFRRILDAGIKVAFGSDCMPMDPMYGIYSATTHPNTAIRITIEEAIRLYTVDAAYASFEENIKGSLAVGKLADFIVLSNNPLQVKPEDLKNVKILETYVGGQRVFSSL